MSDKPDGHDLELEQPETILVRVLLPSFDPSEVYPATSYTVHGNGRLVIVLAEGSERMFEFWEWLDVGIQGGVPWWPAD